MTPIALAGAALNSDSRLLSLGKRLAILIFAAINLYVVVLYAAANVVTLPFPDELSAYNVTRSMGVPATVIYYWENFIGRFSAVGWTSFEFSVLEQLGLSGWKALVAARLFNHAFLILSLYFLIRMVYSTFYRSVCLAISAVIHALVYSSQDLARVLNYWILDHAIYLLSFSTYCILLALFWRLAVKGTDLWALVLPLFFIVFLGAHEVNLVTGGLLLGLFGLVIARRTMKTEGPAATFWLWAKAHVKWGGPREHCARLLTTLCLVYLASACAQVLSPSVAYRNSVWTPQIASFWAWLTNGLKTAHVPFLELLLGFEGSILPLLLFGIILGIASAKTREIRDLRALFLVPPALAFLTTTTIGVLSESIGVLLSHYEFSEQKLGRFHTDKINVWKFAPMQKYLYIYQLWLLGVFFFGAFLGVEFMCRSRRTSPWVRRTVHLLAPVTGLWLLYALFSSPGLASVRAFDSWSEFLAMDRRLDVLNRRTQGEFSSSNSTVFVEEFLNYQPAVVNMLLPGVYPYESQLAAIHSGGSFMFVPCTTAGELADCLTRHRKHLQRTYQGEGPAVSRFWQGRGPAPATGTRFGISPGDETFGSLTSPEIKKGARTLIEVTIELSASRKVEESALQLSLGSADGEALIIFPSRTPEVTDQDYRYALTTSDFGPDGFAINRNFSDQADIFFYVPEDGRLRPTPGALWTKGHDLGLGTVYYPFDSGSLPAGEEPGVYFMVRDNGRTSGVLYAVPESEVPKGDVTDQDLPSRAPPNVLEEGKAMVLDWRWEASPESPLASSFTVRFFVAGEAEHFALRLDGKPSAASPAELRVTGTSVRVIDTSKETEDRLDGLLLEQGGPLVVTSTSWQFNPRYRDNGTP